MNEATDQLTVEQVQTPQIAHDVFPENTPAVKPEEDGLRKDLSERERSFALLLRRLMTPERAYEFLAGQIMMGLENVHDVNLVPEHYGFTREQVSPLFVPDDPVVRWAVDHIGDIWEISAGHTALRLGFFAINEVLRKTTGKEIPDDACFWVSLITTVTIKAVHSLGYISLFGIHDHMANPVPGMLFGQAVAAIALAASHYAAKHHESVKDLALRAATKLVEFARSDLAPNVATDLNEQKNE